MDALSAPRYITPMIVSSCQHCDEQQFQTLSYVHYTLLSVVEVSFIHMFIILDPRNNVNNKLANKKWLSSTRSHSCSEKTTRTPRVHLVYKYNCVHGFD